MKKSTPAASAGRPQEASRSVVTRLRAKSSEASAPSTAEIDLQALCASVDDLPSLNATKMVAVHRRIVNGDYKIDSERLAEKMIALESSLERD